ncbi:MAG: MarR family transcriptional regulator [Clostridia bacterium]|nr:MarR family transcriptional regulator [Clostridia bacterium]
MFELETVLRKFISIDRQHKRLLESQVKKGGMHRSQHRLLLHVYKSPTAPTQKDLAEFFDISSAAVARSCKALEKQGYISRSADEKDSRANCLTVTEAGVEILEKTKSLVFKVDEKMFAGFSEEEFGQFFSCLEKMQKNLNEFEAGDENK